LDIADEILAGRDANTDRQAETGIGRVCSERLHRFQNGAARLHRGAFLPHDRIRCTEDGHDPVPAELDDMTAMKSDGLTNLPCEPVHHVEYLGWRMLLAETGESANVREEHRDLTLARSEFPSAVDVARHDVGYVSPQQGSKRFVGP